MKELVKVNFDEKSQRQLVSARDLYNTLNLKVRFSLWVENNFSEFEEDNDYTSVSVDTEVQNNGGIQVRKLKDYLVTLDMAKELCMLSKTKKGKEVRKYFIEVEKAWNSPDMIMHRALEISNKRIAKLENSNKVLSLQLEEANKKASYLDIILGTPDLIAITQIASDYGMGPKKFNDLLHEKGIQHKVNKQWILYKVYMGKGYVANKTYPYKGGNGQDRSRQWTYWTQKGRKLIYDVLKENGILPLIERDDIA